jgi:hypothetical protein
MWAGIIEFLIQNTNLIQAVSGAVSAFAALASTVIAGLLLQQINLQKRQIQSQEKWNRLNAGFTFFNYEIFYRLEDSVIAKLKAIGVDYRDEKTFTKKKISDILESKTDEYNDVRIAISRLLSFLEGYAIASSSEMSIIDEQIAKQMYGRYVNLWFETCEELIKASRIKRKGAGGEDLFDNLEKAHNRWKKS